jgi:peptidoglycan LD-endopeptidase LytH
VVLMLFCSVAVSSSQPTRKELAFIDNNFRAIAQLRMDKTPAARAFDSCLQVLRRWKNHQPAHGRTVVFPLKGRDCASVPGHGKGYIGASAYSFFDGNKHRGHPALDVFILDRDADSKDDRTGKTVDVLSITDGIVVSATSAWTEDSLDAAGSMLRGGICVWVYDPREQALLYYAHLRALQVQVGDIVPAGAALGQLGRTGKNAALRRSSTHLHVMRLSLRGATPVPTNIFDFLCESGAKR